MSSKRLHISNLGPLEQIQYRVKSKRRPSQRLIPVPKGEYENLIQLASLLQPITEENLKIKRTIDQLLITLHNKSMKHAILEYQDSIEQQNLPNYQNSSTSHFLTDYCSEPSDSEENNLLEKNSSLQGSNETSAGMETTEQLIDQGVVFLSGMDVEEAKKVFKRAMIRAHHEQDDVLKAKASSNLAISYLLKDQHLKSYGLFKQSLKLFRSNQKSAMECFMLDNFVLCCMRLGKFDEALGLALRKMAIAKENSLAHDEATGWVEAISRAINGEEVSFKLNSQRDNISGFTSNLVFSGKEVQQVSAQEDCGATNAP